MRKGTFIVVVAADARPELEDAVCLPAGLVLKYSPSGKLRCIKNRYGRRQGDLNLLRVVSELHGHLHEFLQRLKSSSRIHQDLVTESLLERRAGRRPNTRFSSLLAVRSIPRRTVLKGSSTKPKSLVATRKKNRNSK